MGVQSQVTPVAYGFEGAKLWSSVDKTKEKLQVVMEFLVELVGVK